MGGSPLQAAVDRAGVCTVTPVAPQAIDIELELIAHMQKAVETANKLAFAYQRQLNQMEEMLRANVTGNKDAFIALAAAVRGSYTYSYYGTEVADKRGTQRVLSAYLLRRNSHEISGTDTGGTAEGTGATGG